MSTQYVPLSNLGDDNEPSTETQVKPSFSRSWHRHRRRLVIGLLTTLCALVIYYISSRSTISSTRRRQPDLPASSIPLLSQTEDASRLWFPAIGDDDEFQPQLSAENVPPPAGQRPRTPLFIAFTRNNDMLVQAVVSYIAAGWPRCDIIIVDNSGTMDANPKNLLTRSNPFYLDYHLLRTRYGVSIIQTPTLFSFAQLQNYFLRTAMAHGWAYYFWSHMDVVVLSDESVVPYKSFHARVLEILAELGVHDPDMSTARLSNDWALKYFTYDWLTLMNVESWRTIGAWDPFIPYYTSDCDAYSRLAMHGFTKGDVRAGLIFDVASILHKPDARFFPANEGEFINSARFQSLRADLEKMMSSKSSGHRNEWQAGRGDGGKGEVWTYDPKGFQQMWWDTANFGRDLYDKKWKSRECRLDEAGFTLRDEFRQMDKNSHGG